MQADILSSSDTLAPTVDDESLEPFPRAQGQLNVGIMLLRNREAVKRFTGGVGARAVLATHTCGAAAMQASCMHAPVVEPGCSAAPRMEAYHGYSRSMYTPRLVSVHRLSCAGEWTDILTSDPKAFDQGVFNKLVRRKIKISKPPHNYYLVSELTPLARPGQSRPGSCLQRHPCSQLPKLQRTYLAVRAAGQTLAVGCWQRFESEAGQARPFVVTLRSLWHLLKNAGTAADCTPADRRATTARSPSARCRCRSSALATPTLYRCVSGEMGWGVGRQCTSAMHAVAEHALSIKA